MYTVIGTLTSRTFRVLWALEELGQPYAHEPVPPHSERVMALNATGKIPVLLVDGAALTDSTAILTFLADRHGALVMVDCSAVSPGLIGSGLFGHERGAFPGAFDRQVGRHKDKVQSHSREGVKHQA